MLKQSEAQEERSGTKGRFSMYQTQPVQERTQVIQTAGITVVGIQGD